MIPPRDVLDYLVAELRVGARAPDDVLRHLRHGWDWDEVSACQLRSDIHEARDGNRLTDAEADYLSRGIETWLESMSDEDATESLDDPSIVAMQLTRESHAGPALELRPGAVLCNRYVLGEAVARGGQSVVYRAHVLRDDAAADAVSTVAIKVLRDANPSAAGIARLKREFRQTQSLRHPGVPEMFALECDRGTWFIAMELLDGVSLRTRMKRLATQPLGRPEALRIVAECAAVLARAHRQGFSHGDVKPGNVFLQEGGGVKVLDFGAAYDIQPAPSSVGGPQADTASAAATRTYASPEVLDGLAVDPRDDVFSLACLAYEMLAGRHPFSRVPANQARARALEVMPIVGLAPQQNAALASALAWSRTRRPSSIETWTDALLNRNQGVPTRPKPLAKELTPAEWLPWRWIGAVGAVAAVLFAMIWWASRSSDERRATAATPLQDVSPLQEQPPDSAAPAPPDTSRTLETTATTLPIPLAQASTEVAGETSTSPGVAARPARASAANRVRIETDSSIRISEGAPTAVVVLRRSGNTARPVTVAWQLEDGSARNDEDFTTPATRRARLAAGQTSRAIYVPLVDDDRSEPEETFSLILQSPAEAIGESDRVTITILDDD